MKIATVALVVRFDGTPPSLIDIISDDHEIKLLEDAYKFGESNPLKVIEEYREHQSKEDQEFGDYVEELLSQPFVRPEVQEHGLQWLRSKIRIEQYQRTETEAAKIIAKYALQILEKDKSKLDFMIAGPSTMVRIRIFEAPRLAQQAA